jgi:hypothetical protein
LRAAALEYHKIEANLVVPRKKPQPPHLKIRQALPKNPQKYDFWYLKFQFLRKILLKNWKNEEFFMAFLPESDMIASHWKH